MTAWLVRCFVKNPEDVNNPQVHAAYGILASWVGITVNLLLALTKFLLGLASGSLAIMADAANNLSDAFSSIISLLSMRFAKKPMDSEHPFGHGRMEYIGALGVGLVICLMGFTLLKESITAIGNPAPLSLSWPLLALLLVAVLVKVWLSAFYRRLAKATHNSLLEASSKDSRGDALATAAVLVSTGLQYAFHWQVDGYMGLLVALLVLKAGYDVCKGTINQLLGEKPSPETIQQIEERLLAYPGIMGVHDLIVHDYGPGRSMATAHVEVSAKANIVDIHELIDKAEREISQALHISLFIHMDPIVTDDQRSNEVKTRMTAFLHHTDPRLSLHDFRMAREGAHTTLYFDCALPDDFPNRDALLHSLEAYAKSLDEHYQLIVHFDTV